MDKLFSLLKLHALAIMAFVVAFLFWKDYLTKPHQKVEKEKQALAEDYWGGSPAQPKKPETQPQIPIAMGDPYFAANPHMNLHNLNKFGTLMDEITFDEEEFKNDPEKYLQSLPEECLHEFEDMYHNAHIAEIINDLDEETEN